MNKGFTEAFSQNLKLNSHLKSLILRRTKLNDDTFGPIMDNFPQKIIKLDISHNTDLT